MRDSWVGLSPRHLARDRNLELRMWLSSGNATNLGYTYAYVKWKRAVESISICINIVRHLFLLYRGDIEWKLRGNYPFCDTYVLIFTSICKWEDVWRSSATLRSASRFHLFSRCLKMRWGMASTGNDHCYLNLKLRPPLSPAPRPPPPHFNDGKMARFGFSASSSLIRGVGWFYLLFYCVQDCRLLPTVS